MPTNPLKSMSDDLAHDDRAVVMPLHPSAAADPDQMPRQLARDLRVFGAAFTWPDHYDKNLVARELPNVQSCYRKNPPEPHMNDKRRTFKSLVCSRTGELTEASHFAYGQAINMENPKARDIAAMPDEFRHNPLVEAMIRHTLRVGQYFLPQLFEEDVRCDLHAIRYQFEGSSLAFSTPPFAHRDSEALVHLILLDRQNLAGGFNYLSVNSQMPNVAFDLTQPLQGFFIAQRCVHGVVPLMSADGGPGWRDVLAITLQKLAGGGPGREYDNAA